MKFLSVQTRFKVVSTFLLVCWMAVSISGQKKDLVKVFNKNYHKKFDDQIMKPCPCLESTTCKNFKKCMKKEGRQPCDTIFEKYYEALNKIDCKKDPKKFEFLRCGVSFAANLATITIGEKIKKEDKELLLPHEAKKCVEKFEEKSVAKDIEKHKNCITNEINNYFSKKCGRVLADIIEKGMKKTPDINQVLTVENLVSFAEKNSLDKYPELVETTDEDTLYHP